LQLGGVAQKIASNRKKVPVFVNKNGDIISLEWFNQEISRYAKLQIEIH
jgi:hypothetical protein